MTLFRIDRSARNMGGVGKVGGGDSIAKEVDSLSSDTPVFEIKSKRTGAFSLKR